MRLEDNTEDLQRELLESRLATAARLERAASMLPADPLITTAVDGLKSASLDNDDRRASQQLTRALDGLERGAGDAVMPREFWVILQDAAVQEAEYERAQRYKARAGVA